jgi:hypothetical protein
VIERGYHKIFRVTDLAVIGPYALKIGFDDGALNDLNLFGPVKLDPEVYTLVWPNGADFDPATLHDWPQDSSDVKTSIEKWYTLTRPFLDSQRPLRN